MMTDGCLFNVRYTRHCDVTPPPPLQSFQASCTPFQPTAASVPYSCLFTLSVCRRADVVGMRRHASSSPPRLDVPSRASSHDAPDDCPRRLHALLSAPHATCGGALVWVEGNLDAHNSSAAQREPWHARLLCTFPTFTCKAGSYLARYNITTTRDEARTRLSVPRSRCQRWTRL